jgi:hypothetical protein
LATLAGGLVASGSAFAFPEPYCVRSYSDGVEPITLVNIDGINNTTSATLDGTPDNEDFTAIIGQLRPDGGYPIVVKGNTAGNFKTVIGAYVDWNQNGNFDSDEGRFLGVLQNSTGTDAAQVSDVLPVPSNAVTGPTRMRIVKQYVSNTVTNPSLNNALACGETGYGQAEDYTVNIDPSAPVPATVYPKLSKAFAPTMADATQPTTLTLSLGQYNAASASIALTADLVDTLPAGMTVSATPNASTTCTGSGTLTAAAGASSITLGTGAEIPPAGCTVTVDIQVAGPGNYANTIPANSLKTSAGNYASAVSANYQATAPGFVTYGTGFEAPAFVEGNLGTQGGWGVGGGLATDLKISTVNPAVGSQHLRLNWTAAGSQTVAAISPAWGPGTSTYSVASAKLMITVAGGGTEFDFAPQDTAAGTVVTRVRFLRPTGGVNKIQVLDPNGGGAGVIGYVDTGATWTAGAYFDVKVITDRAAQTYDLCLNGAVIHSGPAFARNTANIAIIGTKGTGTQNNILDADEVVIDNTNVGTCDGTPGATAPTVTNAFVPASVAVNTDSTATITLSNANASAITLTSDLFVSLDAALTTGVASTTCGSGAATFVAGGVALASGSTIPANGSCTLTATVQAAGAGTYNSNVAAGALQTDAGANAAAAPATLTVTGGGGGDPVASVTPTSLTYALDTNTTSTQSLAIANTGGGSLTWSINTAAALGAPRGGAPAQVGGAIGSAHFQSYGNPQAMQGPGGSHASLQDVQMSQTADTVIAPANSVACPSGENHLYRRFYFSEHAGATGNITSIDLGVQETGADQTITVKLYTIPHSTAVDTIPLASLTLIGSGTKAITAADEGTLINVPVTASVADMAASDLVVEIVATTAPFYIGATTAAETHPGFIAAAGCGVATPTSIHSLGPDFANTNIIMVVNTGGSAGETCDNPTTIPWLSATPTSGSTAGGSSSNVDVTVDASGLAPGSYSAKLCVTTNDPDNALIRIPVGVTVNPTGGQNGVITSGPLNHLIAATTAGTSLNIVTSAMDDAGPVSGDWDFNFWSSSSNLTLWKINSANGGQYAIDGSGKAMVFHSGDTIGSSNTFSTGTSGSVTMAADWLAGTDGYLGVKFNCNGRLTFPVSGVCYGYVHLQTTGTTGFPATILDTAFDGDGNAITITGGTPLNDPAATVSPTSLSFTVESNATATEQLNIANAAGSSALTYSIEARAASKAVLYPHTSRIDRNRLSKAGASNPDREAKLAELKARKPSTLALGGRRGGSTTPWSPQGSIQFQLDDGSYENNIGWGDSQSNPTTENSAVWVNRYTATGALTVDSVSIMWPQDSAGTLVGKQVNLVAYYDADGDGDPTNAVRLGTDNPQTIASLDAFLTYTTNFSVPGAGDVYIGFFNTYANGTTTPLLHPAAMDDSTPLGDSWLGASNTGDGNVDFAANEVVGTIGDLSGGQLDGSWLIRATGTDGGSGGACTGPVVSWLTATPSAGSVNGGANVNVTIKADPAAGSLAAGSYTGELCITTNDPTQALIAIPVSLTVTAAPVEACSGGSDQIFCDGFDGEETGDPNVVTGDIDEPVTGDGDGSSFDFALGDFHPYDGGVTSDDINLYTLGLPAINVYWYGDAVPAEFADLVGGVVATPGGTDFRALQSGDTIGPDSPVSAASNGADMSAFEAGVDGYIGVAFYNEGTGAVNYGYLHVTTSAGGFPVQVLDYGYNSVGEAITIP